MKIIKLTAENIKKIVAVDITPDGNLIQITGKNAQGKSSVLDCIWMALGGGKDLPSQPIHTGAKTGEITLDLGEYIVTRKFTEKTSTLTVKNAKGASFPSPQAMLDKMVGDLSFDPLEFSRMKPKEQFERLRTISGVAAEIDEIDGQIKTLFDNRTEVNRTLATYEAQVAGITVPTGTPDELVDVTALVAEGEAKRDENAAIDKAAQEVQTRNANKTRNDEEIADLQKRIDAAKERNVAENDAIQPLLVTTQKEKHDLEPLRVKVASANDVNRAVGEKKRLKDTKALRDATKEKADKLTEAIDELRQSRQDTMAKAKLPVPGITFDDGQVFLNGLPFAQASTAEQLKVSVALAIAANPEIRVIRIKDGSLLDDDNMELIRAMAVEKDYQVWMERVDGSGEVGIVMEEGHVKTVNE